MFIEMIEKTFKGDYYENGLSLGQDLRKYGYKPPVLPEERLKLASECEIAVKRYTPNLLDELNGILEGGNYEETHLKVFSLSLTELTILGCTNLAISKRFTMNGKTIFGRNYDWDKWVADYSTFWKSYPDDGLASISGTDLFVGRYGGLNESGLAIAVNLIRGNTGDTPGVAQHYVVRWVLDRSSNVDQAISFLKKVPHFRANCYLLADSDDTIAYVEATPKKVVVTNETAKGFAAITNHFRSPETKIYEKKELISPTSKPRLDKITNWFNSKSNTVSEKQAQKILTNKLKTKSGVCEDRSYLFKTEEIPYGTIWSWTASLGERRMDIAHKPYSGVEFKSFAF
jgi:predicted choloylglycine hydrolase